jgi:glycosyltransferase involved in cell wall biosynthesis
MKLTIAICAHNAKDRIAGPLKALAAQTLSSDNSWEVLVIDNGSTDKTMDLALKLNDELQLPLRVVHESQLGLTFARMRAAREAIGTWLAFCDDDNLPAPDWVAQVLEFAETHLHAGMFGGKIVPVIEQPELRPADFHDELFGLLGCSNRGNQTMRLERGFPVGAGMVIRRDLLQTICRDIGIYSVGRQGAALTGCEDAEIGIMARALGWELWYCGDQRVGHVMPPHRVNHEYRDALAVQAIRSAAWLQVLRSGRLPKSRLKLRLHAIPDLLRSAKYLLAECSPMRFHRNSARFGHWRRFYAAKACGWLRVANDLEQVACILQELQRRSGNQPSTQAQVELNNPVQFQSREVVPV